MLIIPTSLDTAIVLELTQPLVWLAIAYTALAVGAYCLWEMTASSLSGWRPPRSHRIWLASAAALLIAAGVSSSLMFGSVTFNADGADWISTSWGGVLGGAFMGMFTVCVLVLLSLRLVNAVRSGRSGRRLHPLWWLFGLGVMVAYGLLLAWSAQMPYGSAVEDTARVLSFALAISGIGSLLAIAVIRRIRSDHARGPQPSSV